MVFTYLPSFSSFKVFGLEGQLRETIKEADDAIDRLTDLAKLFSKQAYSQVAYSGTLAGIPQSDRRQLISELDDALARVGLQDAERIELRRSVIAMTNVSLAYPYLNLVLRRIERVLAALRAEVELIQKQGPIDLETPSGKRYQSLTDRQREILDLRPSIKGALDPRLTDPNFSLAQLIPPSVLSEEEEKNLTELAHRIDRLMALTRSAVDIVPEVEEFIDRYRKDDALEREIFER